MTVALHNRDLTAMIQELFHNLGISTPNINAGDLAVHSPIHGQEIARLHTTPLTAIDEMIGHARAAAHYWRTIPAPKRGELIRCFAQELRRFQQGLAHIITIEMGKTFSESLGEVQEMIDICDFSVGLSRQLYGLTIASERPQHRMMETWHPLGVVGLITPFNFPAAVWAWNATIALVCGNTCIWKPSDLTPLTAIACHHLLHTAYRQMEGDPNTRPETLMPLILGGAQHGEKITLSSHIPLISATGSTRMGQHVAQRVAARFGKCILELGGNNAMIVCPSADLNLAVRAITFSAVGTSGQRCTTLRRLFVHNTIKEQLVIQLKEVYHNVQVGSPQDKNSACGPLIHKSAYTAMMDALSRARKEGGQVMGGERLYADDFPDAYYVMPALVEMPAHQGIMLEETFAPILYIVGYDCLDDAIEMNNQVRHGLSSAIFTQNIVEAEKFMSALGSDCGIVNVNIGPSGAEIGGAFGGEKESGGGRESGSDSWKQYMRRATNTINYSSELPLAQGIEFPVPL